ncbi:amino acid adenylation domain-containing protein [Acidobacteriota bacterium]
MQNPLPQLSTLELSNSQLLYKTGDQARWLPDGTVEFLGRGDTQVKIRGFRIELGEIESKLLAHDLVAEAVIIVRESEPGNTQLCAYVVCGEELEVASLREFLTDKLPDYMIPSYFMRLEKLPLNSNGKIDLRVLPEPGWEDISAGAEYVAPRNAVEELLSGIWSEVLGVDKIGIHDNFFNLGGHSLLATQVVSRICQVFNVDFPLQNLFEYPIFSNLAARIEKTAGIERLTKVPKLKKISREGELPLSFAQQRLWFLDQFESESSLYNIPVAFHLSGNLDVKSVELSLTEIIRRHESLRTIFLSKDGQPYQEILPEINFSLDVINIKKPTDKEREAEVYRILKQESVKFLDLSTPPLFRFLLLRLDPEHFILFFNMHHIISDGWSVDVISHEFAVLYRSFTSGETSPLAELTIQYTDFAIWQRQWLSGAVLEEQLTYWKERLTGVPVLEMPLDFHRPTKQTFRGELESFDWPAHLSRKLSALSRETGTTFFMILLAAFKILLYRYTGQEDIAVGSPIANRNRREIEDLIGFFVNTLVLRTDLSGEPTFKDLLSRIRDTALGSYSHQDVPFEMLVDELLPDRDMSRTPLFQVVFTLQDVGMEPLNLPGVESEFFEVFTGTSKFDLSLFLAETDSGLTGKVEYNADLFKRETIKHLTGYLHVLLDQAASDPDIRICDLSILSESEKHRLLVEFNDLGMEYTRDKTIHGLFVEQAAKIPDNIALVEAGYSPVTYEELHRKSSALTFYLKEKGVAAGMIVGLLTDRFIDMITGILGILKSGAAYLPLNPKNPAERSRYMLEDCSITILLAREQFIAGMKEVWDKDILNLSDRQPYKKNADLPAGSETDPAYVIYTSGSTGTPKGVIITHNNFSPLVHWGFAHLRINEEDRALQNLSYYFDWSVWEIFLVLGSGASLYFADEDILLNGRACIDFIRQNNITVLHITPTQYSFLLNEGEKLDTLKQLCVGAEKMSVEMARRCVESVTPGCRVYNMYGPTEATIIAAVLDVETYDLNKCENLLSMPIGKTVGNNSLLILDKSLNPVPEMVTGELYIAGEGVSQGYLNNPELTSDKFIYHASGGPPFCKKVGPKTFDNSEIKGRDLIHQTLRTHHLTLLYKTGDQARWLPDGTVEFLGRGDTQVKIRGFRIELGEIESKLLAHDLVAEAVIIARESEPGNPFLCAYVVCDEQFEVSSLREFLFDKLPDYMVPSYFVRLEKLPLNPNGKVDIKALPEPGWEDISAGAEYVAPRNAIEELLSGIWSEVLGVEKISAHDNFFNLGGHSLLATQVVSRICQVFNVDFPLHNLFEYPALSNLAARIERISGMERQPESLRIEKVSREGELPLSFAQQRLWFLDQYESGSSYYNIPIALRLNGKLDVKSVELSLTEMIRRHESLRTLFLSKDGQPFQKILTEVHVSPDILDLNEIAEPEREKEAARSLAQESVKPFNLSTGPLFRASLLHLDPENFILLLNMHHIISDGWSIDVLLREFGTLYRSFSSGETSFLKELPVQYADFAIWQRQWLSGDILDRQLSYWKEQLTGVAVLELPTDYPRPKEQTFRGELESFELPADLSQKLVPLSRETGTTLFMVLLAAFKVLLYRYTGQNDIAVGSPIANRNRREIEDLIGFFVNTLIMRTDMSGEPTFEELLSRLRDTALGAYSHQDIPFEMLVDEVSPERDLSYTPLFQVMFSLQNMGRDTLELPGLDTEYFEVFTGTSKFDLSLFLSETDAGLTGSVEYNLDLFKSETIKRMIGLFEVLLEQVVSHPEQRICDIPILSESEKQRLLVQWNDRISEYPVNKCIHEWFEDQVDQGSDRTAILSNDSFVTYSELNLRANRLAHFLHLQGAKPEVPVGVFMDRSPALVIGLLAILKAGCAYVPLDPDYPRERIAYILNQSKTGLLLTENHLVDRISFFRGERVLIDSDWQEIAKQADKNSVSGVNVTNLAYIIYTSGSTGVPKGVAIRHSCTGALISWALSRYDKKDFSGVLASTSVCFDLSVFEIFVTLSAGGTISLINSILDLPSLKSVSGISLINTVPSAMRELLVIGALPSSCRIVNLAGEPLKKELVDRIYDSGTVTKVFDLYGPSEDTTYSTVSLRKPGGIETIGVPIDNTRAYILDGYLNPVPVGVSGELCLGGSGLARGYYGRPDLTAERFIPDPFTANGGRLYRTGDLTRYLSDGNIEFLGRLDHQVKIRGFRIELGEIESVVGEYSSIDDVVVIAREDVPGDKQLAAYVVVSEEGSGFDENELRTFLLQRLPAYMVPSAFVELQALPLTPNGKVDRRALPAPDRRHAVDGEYTAPGTVVEEMLAGICCDVLGLERIGIHDNFFSVGGHSLLVTQVVSRIGKIFKISLPLKSIFEYPTISGLAAQLEKCKGGEHRREPLHLERFPREGDPLLSFAQQRLWFLDQYESGSSFYNIPVAIRVKGRLETKNVERSLAEIIRRHESLRTLFLSTDGQPLQKIFADARFSLDILDLKEIAEPDRETEASRILQQESIKPFALSDGPLFRALLLRLHPEDNILLLNMHHIISDGWSLDILLQEFELLYRSHSSGEPAALAELPIQYADFAIWQRQWLSGEVLDEQLSYWKNQLAGVSVLELPTDYPRPKEQTFRGELESFELPADMSQKLVSLSRETGTTLFMVLLAAFKVLLYRYTGQRDIAVGSPIANRNHREIEDLIGFFVNTLIMRTDLTGEPTFIELLSRVREIALAAYSHQDVPFEMLVDELSPERDLSYTPLFQAMFSLQNMNMETLNLPEVECEFIEVKTGTSKFDLSLFLSGSDSGLRGEVEYNVDLFSRETVTRLSGHFALLLDQVVSHPEKRICDLAILSENEKKQLLVTWNDTTANYPAEKTIRKLFEEQVEKNPNHISVVYKNKQSTYRELNGKANRLARDLIGKGVHTDSIVGIVEERSIEMIIGLLGILKAGGSYLPVDANYPEQRIVHILKDGAVRHLLIPSHLNENINFNGSIIHIREQDLLISDFSNPDEVCHSGSLAYVIYTSGTTGRPKGILVDNRNVVRLVKNTNYTRFRQDDRILQTGALSFDASTFEIWGSLLNGLILYLVDREIILSAENLKEAISKFRITTMFMTTALFNRMCDADLEIFAPLKNLFAGGEMASSLHFYKVKDRYPDLALSNIYGPTENTTFSTFFPIKREGGQNIPIGLPIANSSAHVFDTFMNVVPTGVIGELYVGGDGVARGYLNNPELTAQRFIFNPFKENERLYGTGDQVHRLHDGNVEFLGRFDHQVKIRGFRIELGEIESLIIESPGVADAAVLVREDVPGEKLLVVYVVPSGGDDTLSLDNLRESLHKQLPGYMVPSAFVKMESLPLNPNGKVDRKILPKPGRENMDVGHDFVAPRTPTEETIAAILLEVLKVDKIGVYDNFFHLGGHSLIATQVVSRLQKTFQVHLSLQDFFRNPNVADLAKEIDVILWAAKESSVSSTDEEDQEDLLL